MDEEEGRRHDVRRDGDREWVRDVDHQLLTVLTSAQVTDRRLTEIEETLRAMDMILRGDPSEDLDGVVSQMHQIQTSLARLNAVIFMDSTGKKGIQHEVESLLTGEHRAEYQWKFLTSVAVALLSMIGLLVTNWDKITFYLRNSDYQPSMEIRREIEADKKKHRRKLPNPLATDILKAMKKKEE